MRFIKNSLPVLILLFVFVPSKIHAADFSTNLVSTYTVTNPAMVNVNQVLSITNLSDTKYPLAYDLVLPASEIKNLKVTTALSQLVKSDIIKANHQSKISLTFPKPVVGQGKIQTYVLDYQNPDILINPAGVLQLVIPSLQLANPNLSDTVKVIIPTDICPSLSTSVPNLVPQTDHEVQVVTYNSQDVRQSVLFRCADERYVSLNLKYTLTNANMTPIETQIALPPDTAYQQFIFDSINPPPLNLAVDYDNNVIAAFRLEPKEVKLIQVNARAVIHASPNSAFAVNSTDKTYIAEKNFWPIHNPDIKKLTQSLKDPQSIYTYLIQNSPSPSASQTDLKRLGGRVVSELSQSWSTADYVDTFVTLSRAAGIMSRRLVGLAASTNAELRPNTSFNQKLHIWAEYYDAAVNNWVQVDPVWEKSSTARYFPIEDLNHLVFAINGADDTTPYPAGSYQNASSTEPDIVLKDIAPFTLPAPQVEASMTQSWMDKLTMTHQLKLLIKNRALNGIYQAPFSIVSHGQTVYSFTLNRLPPAGQVIIPIKLSGAYEKLTLAHDQTSIDIRTTQTGFATPVAVAALLAVIAGILAVITGRLLVSRRR